jgi:predicted SprT family Zn-dependent metalloprotease
MAWNRSIVFILLLLLYPPEHSLADNNLLITSEESLKGVKEEVVRMYPSVSNELSQLFNTTITDRIHIHLMTHNEFIRLTKNRYISAFAIPVRNTIVIDYSRMKNFYMMKETLKHELCHLFVFKIAGAEPPRWVDEGFCQWVTSGISEIILGRTEKTLRRAVISNRLIPIDTLSTFPPDRIGLSLAYEESKSFTGFLIKSYGEKRFLNFIKGFKGQNSMEALFLKTFGASLSEAQKQWISSLREGPQVFRFIAEHIYEILFFVAAMLTVVGFIALLLRKRAMKKMEEYWDNDWDLE